MTKFVVEVTMTHFIRCEANSIEQAKELTFFQIDPNNAIDFTLSDRQPQLSIMTMEDFELIHTPEQRLNWRKSWEEMGY